MNVNINWMQMQLVALTGFFKKQICSLEWNCAVNQLLSLAAPLISYVLNTQQMQILLTT